MTHSFTRRQLLASVAVSTLAVSALGACNAQGGTPGGEATAGTIELPRFIPAELLKPDLPATDYGAEPGFYSYPEEPQPFFTGPAGSGGDFTTLSIINKTIAMDASNPYWVELIKRLGANWKPQGTTVDTYQAKVATIIAGDDLPDAMQILPTGAPQLPKLLESKFADLSEHLAGDRVKDYPGLANIPTNSWRSTVFNNSIYAIPLQQSSLMWVGTARMDLLKAKGLPTQPKSGDELLEMYRGLTDKSKKQFALTFPDWVLAYLCQCTGAPNDWKQEGGVFTKDYETEQYKQALGIMRTMWSEGLFHPDSYASSDSLGSDWLHTGVVTGLVLQGAWAGHKALTSANIPSADISWFAPPKWDGGGTAASYIGPGMYSMTAVKKGTPERVKEVLRILDRMAAPFGSEEATAQSYGIKGTHWTMANGAPQQTDQGKKDVWGTWYPSFRPQVQFSAYREVVDDQYNAEVALLKDGTPSPVVGVFSETALSKTATLTRTMQSAAADIITGRKELSSWDDVVAAWRSQGGDTMRAEYQDAIQKQGLWIAWERLQPCPRTRNTEELDDEVVDLPRRNGRPPRKTGRRFGRPGGDG